jgi:hypothetical protein
MLPLGEHSVHEYWSGMANSSVGVRAAMRRAPSRMWPYWPPSRWLLTVLLATACDSADITESPPESPPPAVPRVLSAVASANPHNALSASIVVAAENADSARALYFADGQPLDSTPYSRLAQGAGSIVPLGLRAATTYHSVIQVGGSGGTAKSDSVLFTTGELPEILQRVTITTTGTGGSGLNLTSMSFGGSAIGLGFDSAGVIRWYRLVDRADAVIGDLKQQPNGNLTLYVGSSTGSQKVPGYFIEVTPAGDSVRAFTVAEPRYLDGHELWITTGSNAQERIHLFSYDHRVTDLTSMGGDADASLAGHQLLRLHPDGSTEFEWNAWDHLTLDEWIEPPIPGPIEPPDFDHPNSIDFDRDGHYVASFRHLGQVLKVDAENGAILWRLGGLRSDFTFVNDPLNGFSAQHSARVLPNGNLLLFDNGTRHQPPESRAVEYALDTEAKTATLVWQFRHAPRIYATFTGSVQRLVSGNTLIGYAWVAHATEVTPDGSVAWEADVAVDGSPPLLYRLLRVPSLYHYERP